MGRMLEQGARSGLLNEPLSIQSPSNQQTRGRAAQLASFRSHIDHIYIFYSTHLLDLGVHAIAPLGWRGPIGEGVPAQQLVVDVCEWLNYQTHLQQ